MVVVAIIVTRSLMSVFHALFKSCPSNVTFIHTQSNRPETHIMPTSGLHQPYLHNMCILNQFDLSFLHNVSKF